jgi:hypothetical protein
MNMSELSSIQRSNGLYFFLIICLWFSATTLSQANDQGWLMPGETLSQSQSLDSPNGQYVLWMQDDGNLVLYGPAGALFATSTNNQGVRLEMQHDGNLVVYDASHQAVWNSGTQGNAGARLAVQDDGNLVVYAADLYTPLWASNTAQPGNSPNTSWLKPGETLSRGQNLTSANGSYALWMQDDGNLVQYGPNGAMFATSTYGQGARLEMQFDGNLVLYDDAHQALWNSETQGNNGALLAVQDDGNLVVYAADQSTPLWDSRSNTDQLANCLPQSPATFIYNETILPARDDIVVRLQPVDAPCTDTGERVDMDLDERMRVRGAQNGWFYIDAIVDLNGNVLRNVAGWVHSSDVGTNEAVRVSWDQGGVEAWNMDVTIRVDDTTDRVFFNQQFHWNHGGAGYFGFQQFPEGRRFIFSLFSSTPGGAGSVVDHQSDFACEIAGDEPGVAGPLRCLDDFDWAVGEQYTLRLWRIGDETEGTRWGAWILDANGNEIFQIGSFVVRTLSTAPHFITSVASFIEDFDNGRDCSVPASTRFHVAPPSFNNGNDSASYSGHSIGPCSDGSTAASTRFSGGRELRFNVN